MPLMTFLKLRTRCALVVALLAFVLPATAFAAEAESPSSGSGWVAPEGSGSSSGGGSSEAEQGSSLGSGGSKPAPEPESEPVESSPPPVTESFTPEPTTEEATTTDTTPEETSPEVVEAPVAPPVAEKPDPRSELAGGTAPVGTAVLGASAASAGSDAATPLVATPEPTEAGESDSGGLNLYSPAVSLGIVLAFVLAGLAGRFILHRWRRRKSYNREAAEWQAAVRRLDPEQPKLTLVRGDGANGRPPAPAGTPPAKVG